MTGKEQRQTSYTTPRPDVFAMVPSRAMKVLDVGCSNGALGFSLRNACPGRRVVGVEMDAGFAEEAAHQLDHVICADLNAFNWSSGIKDMRFDCIIFADVLEHLVDPWMHLHEAKHFLLPGGCIIISFPNIRHISALYTIFLKGTFPRRDRGIFDSTHLRWFTIKDAKMLITDVGMAVEQMSYAPRLEDKCGGMMNRIASTVFSPIQGFFLVREFLAYQFCLRAVVRR